MLRRRDDRLTTRIFFAGAAGAIGRRLTPMLIEAGHDVTATSRDPARAEQLDRLGAHGVVIDVYDAPGLCDAMAAARPEVVIHQLTDLPQRVEDRTSPEAAERNARIRTEGTKHLVDAALAASARRMIAQSIGFVYAPGPLPHTESDPLDPGRDSVIALERLVTASPPLEGIVLRYGLLYGPGTWYDAPTGDITVHVDAAAHAAFLALERGEPGIYNAAEPGAYASSEKAERLLGWGPSFRRK